MSGGRTASSMSGRFQRFFDWFLSEEVRRMPPAAVRRSRFGVGASLALFILIEALAPVMYQAEGLSRAVKVVIIVGPLCLLNAFSYRWIKSHTLPGIIFCILLVCLLVVASSGAGPISACSRQWHIAAPLLACFLAGTGPALVVGGISVTHLSFLVMEEVRRGDVGHNGEFWSRLATLFVLLFVGGVALIYENTRKKSEAEEELRHAEERERMQDELNIAARIQMSILPDSTQVPGLQVATRMVPTHEVGGDYYDVLPVEGGAWIGIGDVSGHGLNAGLIMMMLQSTVATLSQQCPDASPRELVNLSNRVLFNNIRGRLKKDDYITLSLIRYYDDGRLAVAGAHEDALIWRAKERRCETLASRGAWVGAMRNIEAFTVDTWTRLEPGDVMVLYTDGITEAMNAQGELFGQERLLSEFERLGGQSVEEIRDGLMARVNAWTDHQQDDVTLLVFRHEGKGAAKQVVAA
ncbi:MAG TPA: PP2C family protein-serine/threonine phosphatase [Myxococcaceae bacterium]|nr:PP2C family protein-serine/threonine phosphatase [Myxococcaceae bacterium]